MLLIAFAIPIAGSALIFTWGRRGGRIRRWIAILSTIATSAFVCLALFAEPGRGYVLLEFTSRMTIAFSLDGLGSVFAGLIAFLWPLSMLYAFEYMKHETGENAFFGQYLLSYAMTLLIASAENLFTLYFFFELLTLATVFLVAHGFSHRSMYAGRKYLYYTLGAASLGFLAMISVLVYSDTTIFVYGGIPALRQAPHTMMLLLFVLGFFGFGVKAAVFPLHGWLPTASVAPTPVTSLLHAVAVVNAGVFSVARLAYYVYGPALISGTWAQTLCLSMAAFTILFASAKAVHEQHLKRRLAYSTISNLSYMLFGLLLLTPLGLKAGLMHMIFHSLIKLTLFSCAGAILVQTGREYVQELRGLRRQMPIVMTVFAFCAVELVGIPPFIIFQSKWALVTAAFGSGHIIGIAGVAVLLISAGFTAAYLLKPAVTAFALPIEKKPSEKRDPGWQMLTLFLVITAAMLALILLGKPIADYLSQIVGL
ncbi:MAG: proton-conducting membrane transporter [Clostridiales bacterium]|nr:proton-conducting membrane transporter [Clostridiales bacterium]